ncbi:LPXTG cell wall anchor domain-containing protein [Enterococcus thailandicus]|uniref:LPXTG cell wall anchor domain-containing protein n=1 Tax=Enterococcus thailandicus TaxID=417368 RepID=UPI0022E30802|nr:LPXTG cell wall anchor domain-containing protein [Enterococcus thailandicus]
MCKFIRPSFLVLLCTLTLGYTSEVNARATVQRESEVRVRIINPQDSKLVNNENNLLPKTGSIGNNKFFFSGVLLLLSGAYLIKTRKRKKEQE